MTWLAVAVGASLGAVCRWLLDRALTRGAFPVGILAVNLLGSLLAGVVAGVAPGGLVTALLAAGFLGAFTTASTLALDVLRLYEHDRRAAALDLVLTVGPGLALAALGLVLGRALVG